MFVLRLVCWFFVAPFIPFFLLGLLVIQCALFVAAIVEFAFNGNTKCFRDVCIWKWKL